jgi:hypothetical protein
MLRRRLLFLALPLVAALASPAMAGEDKDKDKGRKEVGQYVDLQRIAMPIIVDGQLVNYVFVVVRLNLVAGADTSRWRADEPYFRDALVRMAHRTSFAKAGKYDEIDPAKVGAALMSPVVAITGAGVVRSIEVTSQTPMHPGRPQLS